VKVTKHVNLFTTFKIPIYKTKILYRDYGEIQINSHTLKNKDNSINKENMRTEISKFMLHTLKFPCLLTFFGGIRKNIDSYVTYVRCRYKSHHKSFRFVLIKLDEGVCIFFISGTKCEEIKHEDRVLFVLLEEMLVKL